GGVGRGVGVGIGVGEGVAVGVAVGLGVSVDVSVGVMERVAVWLELLLAKERVGAGAPFDCGSVLPYAAMLHRHNRTTRTREPHPRPNLAKRVWAPNHCRNVRRLCGSCGGDGGSPNCPGYIWVG